MIVTLQTERIRTIGQVAAFVEANEPVDFQPLDRDGAYAFVARTLTRLGSRAPDRPSKALVKRYLAKTTGYSRAQLTRLIRQHRETARVVDRRDGNQGRPFARVYTPADVRLLARVDEDLGQMSGLATRVVLHREHHVFERVVPTAASAASTGRPTSRRPTTSCAPYPTPRNASGPASRSRNSTPRPTRLATCRPSGPSTRSATGCSDPRRCLAEVA